MPIPPDPDPRSLPEARAYVDQDDIDSVVAALRGERLSDGPAVRALEEGLRAECGVAQAVAMASGSSARHALYHALGVGPGRTVLLAANAPTAAALSVQVAGGEVEFCDIDPHTANLDTRRLEERLAAGPLPAVVTVVHVAGLPCDMEWLLALRRRYDFELVEDGAFALGTRYQRPSTRYRVGEHPDVRAAVLSFHCDQAITTGEGGAVLTQDTALAEHLRRLRALGRGEGTGLPEERSAAPLELGFNYRMSELQAALGASQLKKLPDFLAARREIAMRYVAELRDYELLHPGGPDREHAHGRFLVRTRADERESLLPFLRERGIRASACDPALPGSPWFRGRSGELAFPAAEDHARRALALPIYPSLSDAEQERVIEALDDWRSRARRAG